jgi:sugar phosphate permease
MCWDVHAFAVPILGHARGFSATTIGLVLGTFTASVTLVRLVVPMLAARVAKADGEVAVVRAAMLGTAAVFALYPLAPNAGAMAACAALLGITLGVVQPMMLATLHRLTPAHRHGQALAFRSMAINASSTAMPLVFGAAGATVGAPLLFWLVGGAVGAGSWATRRLEAAQPPAAGAAGEAGASEGSAAGRSTTGTGAGGAQPRGRRDSRG